MSEYNFDDVLSGAPAADAEVLDGLDVDSLSPYESAPIAANPDQPQAAPIADNQASKGREVNSQDVDFLEGSDSHGINQDKIVPYPSLFKPAATQPVPQTRRARKPRVTVRQQLRSRRPSKRPDSVEDYDPSEDEMVLLHKYICPIVDCPRKGVPFKGQLNALVAHLFHKHKLVIDRTLFNKPFKCPYGDDKWFYAKRDLDSHIAADHRTQLNAMVNRTSGGGNFCAECGFVTGQRLKKHKKLHAMCDNGEACQRFKWKELTVLGYKECQYCNKVITHGKRKYFEHVLNNHIIVCEVPCEECGLLFGNETLRDHHVNVVHVQNLQELDDSVDAWDKNVPEGFQARPDMFDEVPGSLSFSNLGSEKLTSLGEPSGEKVNKKVIKKGTKKVDNKVDKKATEKVTEKGTKKVRRKKKTNKTQKAQKQPDEVDLSDGDSLNQPIEVEDSPDQALDRSGAVEVSSGSPEQQAPVYIIPRPPLEWNPSHTENPNKWIQKARTTLSQKPIKEWIRQLAKVDPGEKVFKFDRTGAYEALTAEHVLKLLNVSGDRYLCDSIINIYLHLMKELCDKLGVKDRVCGNLYIITKLMEFYAKKKTKSDKPKLKIPKGTKRLYLPFLVNTNHWVFAEVCFDEKRIKCYNSFGATPKAEMGYLRKEFNNYPCEDVPTPQQANGSDCGVHVCLNIHSLMHGAKLMPSMRNGRANIMTNMIDGYIKWASQTYHATRKHDPKQTRVLGRSANSHHTRRNKGRHTKRL